jgi:hypothetical protein
MSGKNRLKRQRVRIPVSLAEGLMAIPLLGCFAYRLVSHGFNWPTATAFMVVFLTVMPRLASLVRTALTAAMATVPWFRDRP